MGGVAQTVIHLIFVEIPSVAATIVLINIGIAQFKLNAIYEAKKSKDEDMEADSAQTEEAEAQPSSFSEPTDGSAQDISDKEKTEEVNV